MYVGCSVLCLFNARHRLKTFTSQMPKQTQVLIILIYILLPESLIHLCWFGQSAGLITRSPGGWSPGTPFTVSSSRGCGTHEGGLSCFCFQVWDSARLHLGKYAINQMSFLAGTLYLLLRSFSLAYNILGVMSSSLGNLQTKQTGLQLIGGAGWLSTLPFPALSPEWLCLEKLY